MRNERTRFTPEIPFCPSYRASWTVRTRGGTPSSAQPLGAGCSWASPGPSLIPALGLWRGSEVWLEERMVRMAVDELTQIRPTHPLC